MKICKPYKSAKLSDITQGFSDAHKANDWASSYGTFLVAPFNCKIDVVTGADELNGSDWELRRGNGVRMTSIENPAVSAMYWHCLGVFPVKVGDTVLQGQIVAQMGNSGYVESNGIVVPYEIRDNPPYYGTHLHCTIGTATEYWDYSSMIDWSIPVNYYLATTISNILQKISNLLLGK